MISGVTGTYAGEHVNRANIRKMKEKNRGVSHHQIQTKPIITDVFLRSSVHHAGLVLAHANFNT